jgi:hypothetical protein
MFKKLITANKRHRLLIPATMIVAGLMVLPYLLTQSELKNYQGGLGRAVNVSVGTRLYSWTPKPDGCYVTDGDPITVTEPVSGEVLMVLACQYESSDGFPSNGNEYQFTFLKLEDNTTIVLGARNFDPPLPLTD